MAIELPPQDGPTVDEVIKAQRRYANLPITREQLIALWGDIGGDKWLATGQGNCLSPAIETCPDLHDAAAPFSITFMWQDIELGRETWRYVAALGHVIVPPFRVDA